MKIIKRECNEAEGIIYYAKLWELNNGKVVGCEMEYITYISKRFFHWFIKKEETIDHTEYYIPLTKEKFKKIISDE